MLSGVKRVYSHLSSIRNDLILWGHSMGAAICFGVLNELSLASVKGIVFQAPAIHDTVRQMNDTLKQILQEVVNNQTIKIIISFDEYIKSIPEFFNPLLKNFAQFKSILQTNGIPFLTITGKNDKMILYKDVQHYYAKFGLVEIIEDLPHSTSPDHLELLSVKVLEIV